MSQQIKDAFVKLYGTEEAYGNKQAYSALYVIFIRGWNACQEAVKFCEDCGKEKETEKWGAYCYGKDNHLLKDGELCGECGFPKPPPTNR